MVSIASNVRPNIVDTSFTMDEMVKLFSTKGLSLLDLVVLSGSCSMPKSLIIASFELNNLILIHFLPSSYPKLIGLSITISILFTFYNLP